MFEWIWDKIRDMKAENSRRKLARLKEADKEQSQLIDLEIRSIDAEANRLDVETKLIKVGRV